MTEPQEFLDQVTRWQKPEMVELHFLNCLCWRCQLAQEREKEERWQKLNLKGKER